jgi:hypothetical protein
VITMSIDGSRYFSVTDNRHLTGGQVGFWEIAQSAFR